MSTSDPNGSQDEGTLRDVAARWVVRRDRGLTPEETVEFEQWLRSDPRHAAAVARSSMAWRLLDQAPPQALPPPVRIPVIPRRRWAWRGVVGGGLAVAAAVAVAFLSLGRSGPSGQVAAGRSVEALAASPETAPQTLFLPDGTLVRLNIGAEVSEQFTPEERRVRLVQGEAYFTVVKDSARAFIVEAGAVSVRAVGTAFSVTLQAEAVDVLVTEGKVLVSPPPSRESESPWLASQAEGTADAPLVVAGQRAVVALVPSPVQPSIVVSDVNWEETKQALAWRGPLLRLGGATLAELAEEFERQTGQRLILADPNLGSMRLGGRFPSDDVEGFVHVLKKTYGIHVERAADGALILGQAR